jgi:ribosome modulation factor
VRVRARLAILVMASAVFAGASGEALPITCTEDMSCWDGSWRDSRTNSGIGVDRWEHVRMTVSAQDRERALDDEERAQDRESESD